MKLFHALVAALAIAVVPAVLAEAPRTESQSYAGASVGSSLSYACPPDDPVVVAIETYQGRTFCFDLRAGETRASILVQDATGLPVGGLVGFASNEGGILARQNYCSASGPIPAPAAATRLIVSVDGAIGFNRPPACFAGVAGVITATFS